LGNSIAGIVGGGVGGQLSTMLLGSGATAAGATAGNMDIGSIVAQIAGGGGGILMAIIGIIRQAMSTENSRP